MDINNPYRRGNRFLDGNSAALGYAVAMTQIAFQPAPGAPPLTRDTIEDFFAAACKPLAQHRIGIEAEMFLVDPETYAMASYPQITAVLRMLAEVCGWSPVMEDDRWIGLSRDGEAVSLEPGGQFEYAGAPYRTLGEINQGIARFSAELNAALRQHKLAALSLGLHPLARVADIPIIPKSRYGVMGPALEARGTLARHMMRATCGWQTALDYIDEADMVRKMRATMHVTSLVSALYATSRWEEGAANGFAAKRIAIWMHTDPARCGFIPSVFSDHFGFGAYVEYACAVPALFIIRNDQWIALPNMTFGEFWKRGFDGHYATVDDWQLHLTTLFPEVRLKNYLEIRGIDAGRWPLLPTVPALYAGMLASDTHCEAAIDLTRKLSWSERNTLHIDVARDGLAARCRNIAAADLCRELIAIAQDGLRTSVHADAQSNEALEPLRAQCDAPPLPPIPTAQILRNYLV